MGLCRIETPEQFQAARDSWERIPRLKRFSSTFGFEWDEDARIFVYGDDITDARAIASVYLYDTLWEMVQSIKDLERRYQFQRKFQQIRRNWRVGELSLMTYRQSDTIDEIAAGIPSRLSKKTLLLVELSSNSPFAPALQEAGYEDIGQIFSDQSPPTDLYAHRPT